MSTSSKKELSPKQRDELLAALKARFDANKARHPGLVWAKVQARLEARPDQLWSLVEMERTDGEPDVVGVKSGEFVFMDCAPESPAGRRSVCYDRVGWLSRKEHNPKTASWIRWRPLARTWMPSRSRRFISMGMILGEPFTERGIVDWFLGFASQVTPTGFNYSAQR